MNEMGLLVNFSIGSRYFHNCVTVATKNIVIKSLKWTNAILSSFIHCDKLNCISSANLSTPSSSFASDWCFRC